MPSDPRPEISLTPTQGWHCSHLFYRFDHARLRALGPNEIADGRQRLIESLNDEIEGVTTLQTFLVSGQKADFGVLALGTDPLAIDSIHQRIVSGWLGSAIVPSWSFVSLTEMSEYVPTLEKYASELDAQGLAADSEEHQRALKQYEKRLEIMQRQRLYPDLPAWPAVCFYPMNKKREADQNWFVLEFAERERMMREHGASGMKYAGKVTQLVTVGIGLDDWEWGVTLWARNPELLSKIVYEMRFDEASARYAEFGPFYVGYQASAEQILDHCRIGPE
jgi:hydrogen peroxide-dependent heme synthase